MTRFIKLTTILLICFCVQSNAQSTIDKKDISATTTITFSKLEHDFGTLKQGADGTCEFKFKNTGNKELTLVKVKSSCGCTTPLWPKKPIAPGKSDVIKVKYDTKRLGSFNKSITITSNAKAVILKIKGTVVQ